MPVLAGGPFAPRALVTHSFDGGSPTVCAKRTPSSGDCVPRAAQSLDLQVLATDLAADNLTRFWVVGSRFQTVGSHTTLAFSVPENRPGALVQALAHFARRGINLSRIESRPTRRGWGSIFFRWI